MGHAMLRAIGVQQMGGARKQTLPEAAFLVVKPGMDHFAVARGGVLADPRLRFQYQHIAAGCRQGPRHREADHARANDDAVGCLHEMSLRRGFDVRQ